MTYERQPEPAALQVVSGWLVELYSDDCSPTRLWRALDQPLRLWFAQSAIWDSLGRADHGLAEMLAVESPEVAEFLTLGESLVTHWQSTFTMLRGGFGWVQKLHLAAPDIEVMVLSSLANEGWHLAGHQVLAHFFPVRLTDAGWRIASLGKSLPVPGWPPTETLLDVR